MKVSEVIKNLEDVLEQYGDIDVVLYDYWHEQGEPFIEGFYKINCFNVLPAETIVYGHLDYEYTQTEKSKLVLCLDMKGKKENGN